MGSGIVRARRTKPQAAVAHAPAPGVNDKVADAAAAEAFINQGRSREEPVVDAEPAAPAWPWRDLPDDIVQVNVRVSRSLQAKLDFLVAHRRDHAPTRAAARMISKNTVAEAVLEEALNRLLATECGVPDDEL